LPLVLIGGLLLLGVLGSFVISGARRGTFADRLSTYRSEPDGARALYLLLEPAGRVSRWQRTVEDLAPTTTLVMLGARFESEAARMHRFSKDAGDDDEWSDDEKADLDERGLNAIRAPKVTSEERERLLEHVRQGGTLVYAPWRTETNALLTALNVELSRPTDAPGLRTVVPAMPTPFTLGVERVETKVDSTLDLPPDAVPVLTDEATDEVIVALISYGQGKVIVLGAPELAMNSALGLADNAQFWRSMLRALGSRDVAFDEYHHGFTGERSLGEFAARSGLHIAAAQLLLGVMLWGASLRRFGRAREPAATLRVGTTDALFATSRLYREGRHFNHAASTIVRQLAAECAERAGVASHSSATDVSAALEVRGRKDLSTALLAVAQAATHVHSEADLETVARLAALTRRTLHSL
jgi:hypothetical protein